MFLEADAKLTFTVQINWEAAAAPPILLDVANNKVVDTSVRCAVHSLFAFVLYYSMNIYNRPL